MGPEIVFIMKQFSENTKGLFGSGFCNLFLRINFKNIQNTFLVLSKNSYCSFNLVFLCSQCYRTKKKKGNQIDPKIVFFLFSKTVIKSSFQKQESLPISITYSASTPYVI